MNKDIQKIHHILILGIFIGLIVGTFFGTALEKATMIENARITAYKIRTSDLETKLQVCNERQSYNFDAYMNASVDYQNCRLDLVRCVESCK